MLRHLQHLASDLTPCDDATCVQQRLSQLYDSSIRRITADFQRYANGQLEGRAKPAHYPLLAVEVDDQTRPSKSRLAYGKVAATGLHVTTVTRPQLFESYLAEQLKLLQSNHGARLHVGLSNTPIPLTFAMEHLTAQLSVKQRLGLSQHFVLPDLAATHDEIVDGSYTRLPDGVMPISLFPAERVDYSLHRLRHYTATSPEHFQRFVLFTNYQRYVDEFQQYGIAQVRAGKYHRFVTPGDIEFRRDGDPDLPTIKKMPQMPAYHLARKDGNGITLINIGVGPSNAKTITDHVAVLRPHVWLMIGHCGGLRRSQRLGDYVLAHAYLRDDHVLDQVLPPEIPLPTIAEVQLALADAVAEKAQGEGLKLKDRLRTGTIFTTDDRNWELRYHTLAQRFNQSRAIGIDMESATIATNGYRFRVPYGTLLCVSDRPLHGEIKLPDMADAFYEERVSQHLEVGIRTLELLREAAVDGTLHSRKLRSFTEPAFR